MKKQFIFLTIILLILFFSCKQHQKKSGEITYSLITNNHTLIKNKLQDVPKSQKDSLYAHYTSLYREFDTLKVKVYFNIEKQITKEEILSSTNTQVSEYYKKAKVEKYRRNNTDLVWMETFDEKRYKIKETLDPKKHMIPYYDGIPTELKDAEPILGIPTQSGKINFEGNYPQQTSGEFDVWFSKEDKLSVGPEEFFVKDIFILKAVSKDKSLKIKADTVIYKTYEKDFFTIPSVFHKEISMNEYHKIIGM